VSSSTVVGDFNPLKKNALREVEFDQGDAENGFGFQGFEK
jgi:hypothetical protein